MIDHAIAVTDADRGLLQEAVDGKVENMRVRLARRSGGQRLPPESMTPSQTAIQLAMKQQSPVITEDLAQAEMNLQAAASIVAQGLRAVVVIPLYASARASTDASSTDVRRGDFLGVLYMDSKRPTAFSKLDRQILDALAADAASILDNARLVERERERQRLEQEIGIARDIQQALLPKNLREYPHLAVSGVNFPCLSVGGDYFDVFPLDDHRTAFLLADVSGKGLGAALLTTMLQGALSGMTLGTDPARTFNHVNRFLCDHAEVGRYATMFFGILDDSGKLEYINAGHPSPILLRKETTEEAFTEGSFPVGLVPEAEFTTASSATGTRRYAGALQRRRHRSDGPGRRALRRGQVARRACRGRPTCRWTKFRKRCWNPWKISPAARARRDDVTILVVRYRMVANGVTEAGVSTGKSAAAND